MGIKTTIMRASPGWVVYELQLDRRYDAWRVVQRPVVAWAIDVEIAVSSGWAKQFGMPVVWGDPLVVEDVPPILQRYRDMENTACLCWTPPGQSVNVTWADIGATAASIREELARKRERGRPGALREE